MTTTQIILIVLLVLNTLAVVLYLLWKGANGKKRSKSCLLKAGIMLICPMVAPCFFLLAYLFYKLVFYKPVDLDDVIFNKERARTFVHADEDRERNMVSLEEAIEITHEDDLRNLMMNIVRGDIQKSLAAISLALNSEDTETAHYAASVLQDALNDFRFQVQKQYNKLQMEDEDLVLRAKALVEYMDQVLEQRVFTDMEQQSFVEIMDSVCEILYREAREEISSNIYESISLRLLEVEDYEKCRKWCERAVYQYPNTLATYSCQLKLYFNSGQREKFFEVIEELKQSAVVIDSETLELLRVFQ